MHAKTRTHNCTRRHIPIVYYLTLISILKIEVSRNSCLHCVRAFVYVYVCVHKSGNPPPRNQLSGK